MDVETRTCRGVKPLSEEEKEFLDLVLAGCTQTDAIFEAGIFPKDKSSDKKTRDKASNKARTIINSERGMRYMMAHRKTAIVYTPNDLPALATHMYEIAMGRATIPMSTEEGTIEMPPSFKDQISAATWIRAYTKDLKDEKKFIKDKKNMVYERAIEFTSRFKTRPVDDGWGVGSSGLNSGLRNIVEDAIMEEVDG